jgi:invasion protein IalB
MNTIKDHFKTSQRQRCQTAVRRQDKKTRNLKSRNMMNFMNTDNREVNIVLDCLMQSVKKRVI